MIRLATSKDIDRIAELGRELHQSSEFKNLNFDIDKVKNILHNENVLMLVAEISGEVIGYFCGVVTDTFFGNDLIAYDVSVFITPKHRGWAAVELIKHYRAWAEELGCKQINLGISTGTNERISRFYELMGFPRVGFQHRIG